MHVYCRDDGRGYTVHISPVWENYPTDDVEADTRHITPNSKSGFSNCRISTFGRIDALRRVPKGNLPCTTNRTSNYAIYQMQGAGNDFVMLDATQEPFTLTTEKIRALCDRRYGVGCDQLLVVEKSALPEVDFKYRIFKLQRR